VIRGFRVVPALAAALLGASSAYGQAVQHGGFAEARGIGYPQAVPTDPQQGVVESLFRYEAAGRIAPWLRMAGEVEARIDTREQVERAFRIDWQDRGLQRPAIAVRRASTLFFSGPWTAELGKQIIRWGRTDLVAPTDRFAPRDYLEVVDSDVLAQTAARVTWERGADTLDAVVSRFTPSRIPLPDTRWATFAPPPGVAVNDRGGRFPDRVQIGARWSRVGSGHEYSLSFFDGFNHLPHLQVSPFPFAPEIAVQRVYARMRMAGGDVAVPTRWLTLRAEAGYFFSGDVWSGDYGLYVVQLERQTGEWLLVGGYVGEFAALDGTGTGFAPDRGLAGSFLGRASYTIDPNRSIAAEAAVRRSGRGAWTRVEYSHASGRHWRTTIGASFIAGRDDDFMGQFRRNSHVTMAVRYSF
jgi:hypothetical protein